MEGARPARPDDLDILATLTQEAIDGQVEQKGGPLWRRTLSREGEVRTSLERDLADADHLVVLGTIDEVPVGYGVVGARELPDGGRLATISDLYVAPGARGVGVGEAMMNEMLHWARAEGCFGVDSVALPGDRHTKNFFESFGLVARAITVHRPLS